MSDPKLVNSERILSFLKEKEATSPESAIPTIEISQHLYGKGSSRKMVNPTLYNLLKEKKILKITEDREVNPRWYLLLNK